jgi:hypothetical protein
MGQRVSEAVVGVGDLPDDSAESDEGEEDCLGDLGGSCVEGYHGGDVRWME